MEKPDSGARKNPAATAGFISTLLYWWLNPLLRIGSKRRLQEEDMYEVLPEDKSEVLGQKLARCWDREVQMAAKESRAPCLTHAVIRCFWKEHLLVGVFLMIKESVNIAQPFILGKIIEYFENYDREDNVAYHKALGYAAALSLSKICISLSHHQCYFRLFREGWRIRVAMCHLIYQKALCLSNSAMTKTTTGHIVNLLSNDVRKFDLAFVYVPHLLIGLIMAAIVAPFLWSHIGPSCLAGLAIILISIVGQSFIGKWSAKFSNAAAVLTDGRIRTMNEVVSGIRIIKMYAWEKPFDALVSEVRSDDSAPAKENEYQSKCPHFVGQKLALALSMSREISMIIRFSWLRGVSLAVTICTHKIVFLATFTTFVLLGNTISASRVFVTMSLFICLKDPLCIYAPAAVQRAFDANVSLSRIQEFLMLEEITKHSHVLPQRKSETPSVEIQDLICYWDKRVALRNVSVSLKANQLLAVIGPVGAGKSSLLSAILGELPVEGGKMKVNGKLTYTSQQPWVFSGSVRSNILFGKELNPQKYQLVLEACALKRDLELLPHGDLTLIGDRGITLSGGQKARVNLARAVYEDADIYLLDDPLSAVDAEVGKYLFERCICGLLKGKIRILVTHQLQYLKAADQILVLQEGNMSTTGTYRELQQSGLNFTTLLKDQEEEQQQLPEDASQTKTKDENTEDLEQLLMEAVPTFAEESRLHGTVSAGLYVKYLRAGNNIIWLIFALILYIVTEVSYVLQDWWLSHWSNEQVKLNANSSTLETGQNMTAQLDIGFYLSVYAGLSASTIVLCFARNMLLFQVLLKSAQSLHNKMFTAAIRAPARFFDINPIGRVLNRFSRDMGEIDVCLPQFLVEFIQMFMNSAGMVIMSCCLNPWILVPVLPLVVFFCFFRRYYLRTSGRVALLEATTRSPVFSHLSASLDGLCTIRAFGAEQRFQEMFHSHQDIHSEASYLVLTIQRWFGVRVDIFCAVFVTVVSFGCVLLRGNIDAGSVGLSLSYAITVIMHFQSMVRLSAEVENKMTSVERGVEYTELESEAPWETKRRPPADWPRKGLVTFDQVDFSYSSDGPLVLKDLRVTFRPKEKVGVVGRTGAGKSSLVSALFRLSEPQGNIYIDGVLTSEIGLHDLRQKISIIPQDPVLFAGTMRKNLDPFEQHLDEELWDALEKVQLKPVVEELPAKMESILTESGSNFSVGQRQLVCLARAILRKNRILVIDEATANVDLRTDEVIQKTIRDTFRDCTVITIAHRLNTIMDSDRVLVLDSGRIHACDAPYLLLQDPEGIFSKLVHQTGKQEAAHLRQIAKQVFENRDHTLSANRPGGLIISETTM